MLTGNATGKNLLVLGVRKTSQEGPFHPCQPRLWVRGCSQVQHWELEGQTS